MVASAACASDACGVFATGSVKVKHRLASSLVLVQLYYINFAFAWTVAPRVVVMSRRVAPAAASLRNDRGGRRPCRVSPLHPPIDIILLCTCIAFESCRCADDDFVHVQSFAAQFALSR